MSIPKSLRFSMTDAAKPAPGHDHALTEPVELQSQAALHALGILRTDGSLTEVTVILALALAGTALP
jgi:hypothetical protein